MSSENMKVPVQSVLPSWPSIDSKIDKCELASFWSINIADTALWSP